MSSKYPTQLSGDASKYFGLPPGTITWAGVNSRLKRQGSSLHQWLVGHGFKPDFQWSLKSCKEAIQAYFDTHRKAPSSESGDASVYLGLPEGSKTWKNMDQWLKSNLDTTVARLVRDMGLKPDFQWSWENCRQAMRAYKAKHKRYPTERSGDASEYLGLPPGTQTFMNMSSWLRARGSSIAKFKKARLQTGIKRKKKPEPTPEPPPEDLAMKRVPQGSYGLCVYMDDDGLLRLALYDDDSDEKEDWAYIWLEGPKAGGFKVLEVPLDSLFILGDGDAFDDEGLIVSGSLLHYIASGHFVIAGTTKNNLP